MSRIRRGATILVALLAGADADAAGPSIRDLVEVTDLSSLSASPDGRHLVFRTERADVERNSYILEWHAVDLAAGEVRRIGSGGDPIYADPGAVQAEAPIWAPDGKSIFLRALIDGAVGVWKADVSGASMTALIVRDEDVETLSLSPDGKALIYEVGPSREEIRRAEQHEYDSGILVDSSVDLSQNLFRGASVNGRMSSQRLVGYWFVRAGLLWRSPRQRRRYDLGTGRDEPVGAPLPVPPFQPPQLAVAASARSQAGDAAEASWDGETGSVTATLHGSTARIRCSDPLCSSGRVSALVWRPGAPEVLVTFMDRHRRQSLYLWNMRSNALRPVIRSDGLLSGGRRNMLPCALSKEAAFCIAAGAASPPALVRIDLETGTETKLHDPNAQLRSAYSPQVEQLTWRTGDGRTVAGTLLTPPGPPLRAAPLFVNYYLCAGFLRGGEGDEWPIPSLLDAGFAVACINAVPMKGPQDAVATYKAGLDAVRSLISLLSKRGLVDRHRVAMGGFSFGSEVAIWTAIHSDLLAAVSIASAQGEPSEYWMSAMPGSDHPRLTREVWGLGRPEETPLRWKLVSPALNAERIQAPVLFQLPEQEARRIPELYARLSLAGTPTELYAFPGEAHIKVQPRHRAAVYERNLDWFLYWLQDHRDPAPAKSNQYHLWGLLKARRPK
jgi:dipeptidyl aminopeptidase/acylaminoacyl peptidase